MTIAIKTALFFVVILVSIAVYTIVYAAVSCAITHSKAFGLGVLWKNPLYWMLLAMIVGSEVWLGRYIVSR